MKGKSTFNISLKIHFFQKIFFEKLLFFTILLFAFNQIQGQKTEKDSLENVIKTSKNDSLRIDAYNKLFFIVVYSDPKTAKGFYETLFKMGKKNPYAKARAYNLQGIYYDIKGNIDSASISYKNAIKFSRPKYPNVEGSAYNNMGLIQWNKGEYIDALESYNKALKLFEKTDNKMLQGNVLSNIGLIYDDLKEEKNSEFYLKRALSIREELKDEYGISVSLVNLGVHYGRYDKGKKGIEVLDKAIALKRKINDEVGLALALYNKAYQLNLDKKYPQSQTAAFEAEKLYLKNNSEPKNLVDVYLCMGENYLSLGQTEQCNLVIQKIEKILKNHDLEKSTGQFYHLLSSYYSATNQYKTALEYRIKSDSIYEKLKGVEVQKFINLYETQYKVEKKEKELSQTKNKLLFQETQNRKKNTYLLLSGMVLLFSIVTAFLISRALRLKNKHQKKEFELQTAIEKIESQNQLQEQRLSISRDLHDNIGAQLTFIISSIETLKSTFKIDDEKINNKLNSISNFTRETITELRDTIWAMNNSEISFDEMQSRITNFVEKAKKSHENVHFNFKVDKELQHLKFTSTEGMNVYRIIQEAVNNALKYSEAQNIEIFAKKSSEGIEISISDDGKGFNKSEITPGSGLQNMKKRAVEIGKTFNINSEKGKGTIVSFTVRK